MYATKNLRSPVVTLLSPSPLASRKAQEILHRLTGLDPVDVATPLDDKLNTAFGSFLPGFSRTWHSMASQCPTTGSVFHFCSIEGNSSKQGPLALLALTDSAGSVQESIQEIRNLLSEQLESRSIIIKVKESMGTRISPKSLLKSVSTGGLPLLQLPSIVDSPDMEGDGGKSDPLGHTRGLKEIVIPYFDYALFRDGSSLLSRLSESSLERPAVGVYRWKSSTTHIRPLPSAGEDKRLPPLSLIFGCTNLNDILEQQQPAGVTVAKIGYSGNKSGQLILLHEDLQGIDLRLCSERKVSSAFCEAQESLLAASLDDLTSTNTLLGDGQVGKDDKRIGQADCWVEVRANLKKPSGFFHRGRGISPSKHRVAKAPDIPYE